MNTNERGHQIIHKACQAMMDLALRVATGKRPLECVVDMCTSLAVAFSASKLDPDAKSRACDQARAAIDRAASHPQYPRPQDSTMAQVMLATAIDPCCRSDFELMGDELVLIAKIAQIWIDHPLGRAGEHYPDFEPLLDAAWARHQERNPGCTCNDHDDLDPESAHAATRRV